MAATREGDIFAVAGLVMIIGVRPDGFPAFKIAQFGVKADPGDDAIAGHFLEIVKMAGENEIRRLNRCGGPSRCEAARGAQFPHQGILEHFGGEARSIAHSDTSPSGPNRNHTQCDLLDKDATWQTRAPEVWRSRVPASPGQPRG